MRNKKLILGIIILVAVFLGLSFGINNFVDQLKNLNKENSTLIEENNKLKKEISEQIGTISNLNSEIEKREEIIKKLPKLEPYMVEKLKTKGLKGDCQEIISDLMKHSELIPYEGIVGGKMGFYDESKIHVLTDQWVLAEFNDGHIGGYMLLKYEYSNNKILWKVIESYLM